mmetsp:Transcript_17724/g.53310  ORF Transcript_17724/g.53310 Transcript_17724/m.53310 type:complete len:240 (+) Transcript_17724:2269-2988(+)
MTYVALGSLKYNALLVTEAQLLEAGDAGLVDHAGGPAHAGHRALPRGEAVLLNDGLGDATEAVRPLLSLLWLRHYVPHSEVVVFGSQVVQLGVQQDVVGGLVGVDERHLRPVLGVFQNCLQHLPERGNAGAAGEHGPSPGHLLVLSQQVPAAGEVGDVAHGALGLDGVPQSQALQMLAHLSAVRESLQLPRPVHLDDQFEVPQVVVAADGRVRPHHQLPLHLGIQEHVLPHGQPEPVLL